MKNQLHNQTSPYLQQHKDNPVHWQVWNKHTLNKAKQHNKPILLSIGYATCHWCHVMARESFQNQHIANIINQHFIPIKIDREERPDIDTIYMQALQDLGQHGGWPLTMFLDANAQPFWGGTYFPHPPRQGMIGFENILNAVIQIWNQESEHIQKNREALRQTAQQRLNRKRQGTITPDLPPRMAQQITQSFDMKKGGIKALPKFPNIPILDFLWRLGLRHQQKTMKQAVIKTLEAICLGGIYDHLGGGFARYSVDENWRIPHFEKMLCDNALLISLLSEVWRETHNPFFADRVRYTINFLLRELLIHNEKGEAVGFAAGLDADSKEWRPPHQNQLREGAFYTWTESEIDECLKNQHTNFKTIYNIQPNGNWAEGGEKVNILWQNQFLPDPRLKNTKEIFEDDNLFTLYIASMGHLDKMKKILFDARQKRPQPLRDDKIITHWNGLAVAAIAHAGWVFGEKSWRDKARHLFTQLQKNLIHKGRLHHHRCQAVLGEKALLDDYAGMIIAAITLYQQQPSPKQLQQIRSLLDQLNRYHKNEAGGFYFTPQDAEDVPLRQCSADDGPYPSAHSLLWRALALLFTLEGKSNDAKLAEEIMTAFGRDVAKNFPAHAGWLAAHDLWHHPMSVILLEKDKENSPFIPILRQLSLPDTLILQISNTNSLSQHHPAFGKTMISQKPTAYVCLGDRCLPPIHDPKILKETLFKERKS